MGEIVKKLLHFKIIDKIFKNRITTDITYNVI